MAKNNELPTGQTSSSGQSQLLSPEFMKSYGTKGIGGLVVLVLALSFGFSYFKKMKVTKIEDTQELGLSMKYLINNQNDSAEMALKEFLTKPHDDVSEAKANLLLGKIFYNQKKYAGALEIYSKINLSDSKYSLITSGSKHGIAACYIQQQQYDKAVTALNEFLNTYQKKNKSNLHDKKIQDLSPAIPNALFKLALCYKQLGNSEKMKETASTLKSVYGESEESQQAEKLLLAI